MSCSTPVGRRTLIPILSVTIALTAATLVTSGRAVDDSDDSTATWIAHAVGCLEQARTLEADFTQELIHRLDGRSQVARGKLQARRGKKLRLEYDAPARSLLVSDGKTVRSWDQASRTMYESPVRGTVVARTLSYAIDGPKNGDFDARWLGGADRPAPGKRGVIELRPTFDSPLASRIAATLEGSCPPLVRLTIVDRAGTATRLTLSNQKLNRVIPAGRFVFEPPPGATVVKP